jgi:hypothetical protein
MPEGDVYWDSEMREFGVVTSIDASGVNTRWVRQTEERVRLANLPPSPAASS